MTRARAVLIALAALLASLCLARAVRACPTATDVDAQRLPAGCPAPLAGWLIIDDAYAVLVDQGRTLSQAELQVSALRNEVARARLDAAAALDRAAARLEAAPEATAAAWVAAGVAATLACATATFAATGGSDMERASWGLVGGGVCGAGMALMVWTLE